MKMINCEIFKNRSNRLKFGQNCHQNVKLALRIFAVFVFWTSVTVCFDWTFMGIRPLRVDQIIFLICAILSTIISWEFTSFGNRFIRTSTEIVMFMLIEVAMLPMIAFNVAWLWNYGLSTNFHEGLTLETDEDTFAHYIGILTALGYIVILFPVMNAVTHSMFIYHLIRGTEKKVGKYIALVLVIYCLVGIILIIGMAYLIIRQIVEEDNGYPDQEKSSKLCIVLLLAQTTVFLVVSITAIESTYGNEASTMEKATSLIFFRICRVVAVALQTVSIVAILVDNIQILSTSSVNVLDKYVDLETTSRIWFVSVCTAVSFLRQFYLTRKMAQRNASGYSPATLM